MKLDLMEAAHSGVDRCQLALLHDLGFRPSGCYETQRQNWRLPETLTHVLAETKQAERKLIAPVAEPARRMSPCRHATTR